MCWERRQHPSPDDNHASVVHSGVQNDYSQIDSLSPTVTYACRWKCCLLSTCIALTLILLVSSLIIFMGIVPHLAQTTINSSNLVIQSAAIFNAQSSTFSMNSTIRLTDVGSNNAVIKSCNASLAYNGQIFGYVVLPQVSVDTSERMHTLSLVAQSVTIVDRKVFQKSASKLLNNVQTVWHLDCPTSVAVTVAGIKLHIAVRLQKDLVLPGSPLLQVVADNLDVDWANATHLRSFSDVSMVKQSAIDFDLPLVRVDIYVGNVQMGSGHIGPVRISSGVVELKHTELTVIKTKENVDVLSKFFTAYISGKDQYIRMIGPFAVGNESSVLDGVMNETVLVRGTKAGALAVGGSINSKTLMGYPRIINQSHGSTTVRGAYAVMQNPLSINMRLHAMDTRLDLNFKLAYTMEVKLPVVGTILSANCSIPHHTLSSISMGAGMYPNVSKTTVDVAGKSKASFFVFADPQPYPEYPYGQKGQVCKPTIGQKFPFSCCFVSLTTAAACYRNQAARIDPTTAQLDESYVDVKLYGNISVELGAGFRIVMAYEQDFFPLYFGYEVYAGFVSDAEMSCKNFKFL